MFRLISRPISTKTKSFHLKNTPFITPPPPPSSSSSSAIIPLTSTTPFLTQKRFIDWSHFSPRSKAQQARFRRERATRSKSQPIPENEIERMMPFRFEEENELIHANVWMEGRFGVNKLTLDQKSKLPMNYLNDFPDC
jgi:hypothetical protein